MSQREKLGPRRIGVDLGASGVRVWCVGGDFGIVDGPFERSFDGSAFTAVAMREQLVGAALAVVERVEAARRIGLVADAVAEAACGACVEVAVAAPGLRSEDGRGLVVARNGPRMPEFCPDLERELAERGVELARALPALVGDGEAAGWGELAARDGAVRGARSALVLVGGSGVAEVFVHAGKVMPLERLDPPLLRAWEIDTAGGLRAEDCIAPGRLNARWQRTGALLPFEVAAARGDADARQFVDGTTAALAAHLTRRTRELAKYEIERVVLAGALARMLERDAQWFAALQHEMPATNLVLSTLRAAPAIGAVAMQLDRTEHSS